MVRGHDAEIHFRDLTDKERDFVTNGCGGKGGIINPPEFIFHASCDRHDFGYVRGGTEENRKRVDRAFLKAMLQDVREQSWWKRAYYYPLAYTYYNAVRAFGGKFWNYREAPMTKTDLQLYIGQRMRELHV